MQQETAWKARELEILRLMSKGLTDGEIGARLHLAHETIRWYNKQIYQKLVVTNRTQAVRQAATLGLLDGSAEAKPDVSSIARPPIRYVANGDVHIAYAVMGHGPVDLLFIHGFLSHLELAWEEPGFVDFFERLGHHARVILFDKRGVGLSDRIQGTPTLENTLSDARAVLDAVGSDRAYIMGTSESGAAAILMASTYPELVRGLILYATTAKLVRDGDEPIWAVSEEGFERFIQGVQKAWGGPWALAGFAPSRVNDERFRVWWARVLRSASSPSSIRSVIALQREIDIRDLLPHVRVRTVVIHKRDDRMVNVEAGRYLADQIPNATWVELPGEDHIYFVDSDGILRAVARFIEGSTVEDTVDSRIAIILSLKSRSGPLPAAVTAILSSHRPWRMFPEDREALAIFDSPARAVQCARRLRDPELQMGLHVGECDAFGGRPVERAGATVRQAAKTASPGEILVTQTLRDILAGTGLVLTALKRPTDDRSSESEFFFTLD